LLHERTADGILSNFDLVLERVSPLRPGQNLLEPTGHWHGYQKFFFAASDFAHGPDKSIYGNPRTIDLPRLGMAVVVTVVRVVVTPAPTRFDRSGYRFTAFTVRVDARTASVGAR
jgi:hypothetical protein